MCAIKLLITAACLGSMAPVLTWCSVSTANWRTSSKDSMDGGGVSGIRPLFRPPRICAQLIDQCPRFSAGVFTPFAELGCGDCIHHDAQRMFESSAGRQIKPSLSFRMSAACARHTLRGNLKIRFAL